MILEADLSSETPGYTFTAHRRRRSINIPGSSGCPRDTVRGIGMDIGLQDESCSLN